MLREGELGYRMPQGWLMGRRSGLSGIPASKRERTGTREWEGGKAGRGSRDRHARYRDPPMPHRLWLQQRRECNFHKAKWRSWLNTTTQTQAEPNTSPHLSIWSWKYFIAVSCSTSWRLVCQPWHPERGCTESPDTFLKHPSPTYKHHPRVSVGKFQQLSGSLAHAHHTRLSARAGVQGTAANCLSAPCGPSIITAPRPRSTGSREETKDGVQLPAASHSQSSSRAGPAQASPHPHPLSKSLELKGPIVGTWRWGGEWSQSCELESIYSESGIAHPPGTVSTLEPQELGISSAGWTAELGEEESRGGSERNVRDYKIF